MVIGGSCIHCILLISGYVIDKCASVPKQGVGYI